MSKKILNKNLRRYKRNFAIVAVLIGFSTLLLLVISVVQIVETVKSIKKLQSLIESNFSRPEEMLEFKAGNFSFIFPEKTFNYVIKATVSHNISTQLPLKGVKPYKMEGFESQIYKLQEKAEPETYLKNWLDYMKITSNFISVNKENVTIYGEVKGFFDTKENPRFKNTLLFANSVNLKIANKVATGNELRIANAQEGKFSATNFEILTNEGKGKFKDGVLFENNDYKITAETLNSSMQNGEIESLLFQKNVIFNQKGESATVVIGDNAFYDYSKSEIKIYGNVVIKSTTNNLQIESETFTYNEKTKLGTFEAKKNENGEKSKINLSIDL